MLPEHVEALKQMFAEEERKPKPLIDEQQKMEIDFILQAALNNDETVEIKYYADYDYQSVRGQLLMIDILSGRLRLDGEPAQEIHLQDILDVSIL